MTRFAYYLLAFSLLFIGIVGIGSMMNHIALSANGGFMPVYNKDCDKYPNLALNLDHVCAGKQTVYPFLIDRHEIRGTIYSLGDLFIIAGVFGIYYLVMPTLFFFLGFLIIWSLYHLLKKFRNRFRHSLRW